MSLVEVNTAKPFDSLCSLDDCKIKKCLKTIQDVNPEHVRIHNDTSFFDTSTAESFACSFSTYICKSYVLITGMNSFSFVRRTNGDMTFAKVSSADSQFVFKDSHGNLCVGQNQIPGCTVLGCANFKAEFIHEGEDLCKVIAYNRVICLPDALFKELCDKCSPMLVKYNALLEYTANGSSFEAQLIEAMLLYLKK